jgi:hypothetical protein
MRYFALGLANTPENEKAPQWGANRVYGLIAQ